MGKQILMFGDIEIQKNKFYHKTPIFLQHVDIEKILVSNKISFGEKTINTLLVPCKIMIKLMLPKTRAHVKGYEGQTKWTYFLIEHDDLLEKCNIIWDKISANIKKEFDSKLVYKKNQNQSTRHRYDVTDFHDKETPTVDSNLTC